MLARQATCDNKALARPIVSLVPGYPTAILSRPDSEQFLLFYQFWEIGAAFST